jgi:hypothetical protein
MNAARLRPGAISESSSSHLPDSEGSKVAKPVMFPPGWLSRGTMLLTTGSPHPPTFPELRVDGNLNQKILISGCDYTND